MQTLRYVVCDVLTDTPLTGNQLAVFTDGREVDDALMQHFGFASSSAPRSSLAGCTRTLTKSATRERAAEGLGPVKPQHPTTRHAQSQIIRGEWLTAFISSSPCWVFWQELRDPLLVDVV